MLNRAKEVFQWWLGIHPKQQASIGEKALRWTALCLLPFGTVTAGIRTVLFNLGRKLKEPEEIAVTLFAIALSFFSPVLCIAMLAPIPLAAALPVMIWVLSNVGGLALSAIDNEALDIDGKDGLQRRTIPDIISAIRTNTSAIATAFKLPAPDTANWGALSREQLVQLDAQLLRVWQAPVPAADTITLAMRQEDLAQRQRVFEATLVSVNEALLAKAEQQQRELAIEQRVEQLKAIVEV